MKMPEKVRLAVNVIRYLKLISDGKPRRVEDLAIIFGTSKNFLHQVVAKLRRAGMVVVIKGPKGGVGQSINDHTLLDVYQLFGYMTEPEQREELPSDVIQNEIRKFVANIVL